jgi:hypothetical protein
MSLAALLYTNYFDDIEKQALITINKDRSKYSHVWETIEKYCANNSLIISNIAVLLDKQNELRSVFEKNYKIYTSNPLKHANDLVNLIHKNNLKDPNVKFTKLRTIQENEEFIIDYDSRIVATIYKLQKHKSVEPADIIKPVEINNILYMPSEIEIIDVYHSLYIMNDYDINLQYEELLYKQVLSRKEHGVIGAGCREKKKELIEAIKISLVIDWLYKYNKHEKNNKIVLVGPWAYSWLKLGRNICINLEKIQILADLDPNEVLNMLRRYIALSTKFLVTMREQELHIPKDFRVMRYTYYLNLPSEKGMTEKPFLDLFNCASFELIPYKIIDGLCIGDTYCMLRFLFIDLWIIRVIKTLKLLSNDVLNKKLLYLWELIDYFRNNTIKGDVNYIGTFKDAIIDKKINNLKEKVFYPYFPELYLKDHPTYRKVN